MLLDFVGQQVESQKEMWMLKTIDSYEESLINAIAQLNTLEVTTAALLILDTIQQDGTIYTCGNGGSASTASHMVCDLVKNTGKNMKVVCLNDSISTLTAYANDIEYDAVFSEPLSKMIYEDDLLIAISTSGESKNVLAAIEVAKVFNASIVLLTGPDMQSRAMISLYKYPHAVKINVTSDNIGVIEDVHLVVNHMLTEIIRGI